MALRKGLTLEPKRAPAKVDKPTAGKASEGLLVAVVQELLELDKLLVARVVAETIADAALRNEVLADVAGAEKGRLVSARGAV